MKRVFQVVFHSIRNVLCAGLTLGGLTLTALAEPPKSLLPVFGTVGREIQPKAMTGYDIRGWLPKDWVDNSSWAPVSAVYSQLNDPPDKDVGAVRIEVTKLHSFHLQLTTKGGAREYKKGTTYVLSGWVRGSAEADIFAGFRQDEEPRNFYAGRVLEVGKEWQRFNIEWEPEKDSNALVLFTVHKVCTVDLAGITLEAKP